MDDLIFNEGTAWEFLTDWIKEANNITCVLKPQTERGKEILSTLQITNKSTMGSIALETRGIVIDNGWLKILGSGNEKICGDIFTWNGYDGSGIKHLIDGGLIVAYDVIGGFFAINSGAFGGAIRKMYYFAPESLEKEEMEYGYTDFIYWALNGDLDLFYKGFRWDGWEKDVIELKGNEGFGFYPFLWTKEGSNIKKVRRSNISIEEIWNFKQDFLRQLG